MRFAQEGAKVFAVDKDAERLCETLSAPGGPTTAEAGYPREQYARVSLAAEQAKWSRIVAAIGFKE